MGKGLIGFIGGPLAGRLRNLPINVQNYTIQSDVPDETGRLLLGVYRRTSAEPLMTWTGWKQ